MTTQGVNPEEFNGGEAVTGAVTLDSRFPAILLPENALWPVRLHDEAVREAAAEMLPKLMETLSVPIQPATQRQLHNIFDDNPHHRRMPWTSSMADDGSLTFSTGAYLGPKDERGAQRIYYGINYTFDQNGRLTKYETIEDEHSYDRGRPNYQEFLKYDDQGYLTERLTWAKYDSTVIDRFDYADTTEGGKTPVAMTRSLKVQANYESVDSEPMPVDLANYEEWLETNPNGFRSASKEELEPQELHLDDFKVSEDRRGILFSHPEQLEHALVMYGEGTYPTPGTETALEHNEEVFLESSGPLGAMLFSASARSGDMSEFVRTRITDEVQKKWNAVQKSKKSDAAERVHFSFDYDGAGHFHKTNGEVEITKAGLELTLSAAYVGDQVEDRLASALDKKRGLRSATIEVPINQTENEGYFLVDVKAACEKLGIPVTDSQIWSYFMEYLSDSDDPTVQHNRRWGRRPALWQDEANGVSVLLATTAHDYDSKVDLDKFFGHDATSIWGPLPKNVRHLEHRSDTTPKIQIIIEPSGNPFDEDTTKKADETIRSYMSKLEQTT